MNDASFSLKNARKSRNLTLAKVSQDTGIPLTTINAWERGACYPRGENRDIICQYYGLPKESLDYTKFNLETQAREFDLQRIAHNAAMSDYETKPIMLHKLDWQDAAAIMQRDADRDFNQLIARLIRAAAKESTPFNS